MHLKGVENENAERALKLIVPKEILDLKPIIAGGFIVSLYQKMIRYSNLELFNKDLSKKIDKYESSCNEKRPDYFSKSFDLTAKFNDIDFWFHESNPIWKPNSKTKSLIKDYSEQVKESKYKGSIYFSGMDLPHIELLPEDREQLSRYKLSPQVNKTSYWANSFTLADSDFKIQFIRKSFLTTSGLLNNFDIINCCAAFYNNKFYFHNNFENLYDQSTLSINPLLTKATSLKKIFAASRIFKYVERYCLEPDENTCYMLFETMSEAADLDKRIKMKDFKDNIIQLDPKDDAYGRKEIHVIDLQKMIDQLFGGFGIFAKFKNYNEIWDFYFLGTNNDILNKYLKIKMSA